MSVGDSITEQGDVARTQLAQLMTTDGWKFEFVGSKLNKTTDAKFKHNGYGGWTTTQINEQITTWIQTYQPDIVLLMIGTNDLWQSKPIDQTVANINDIVDKIFASHAQTHIMVAKILPMGIPQGRLVDALNEKIENILKPRIAAGEAITIVDMHSDFSTIDDMTDGVHLNDIGNKKMGERWYQYIKKPSSNP